MKTVCIRVDDSGKFSVGEMPSGMDSSTGPTGQSVETPPEPRNMQPAEDLDAALDMAAGMLEADPAEELESEAAFMDGYKETAGGANRMSEPEQM